MSSLGITFEVKGLKEALRAVNRLADELHSRIPAVTVKTLAETALAMIKSATPGSGQVRDLWRAVAVKEGRSVKQMVIVNGLAWTEEGRMILSILEGGSRPHKIMPIPPNTVLRFYGGDGSPIFARSVMHPGTRPYRMVSSTVERMQSIIDQAMEIAADAANRKWEAP